VFIYLFFLTFKAKLQVLKFEFCQLKLGRPTDKLAINGKFSLKLDSNASCC